VEPQGVVRLPSRSCNGPHPADRQDQSGPEIPQRLSLIFLARVYVTLKPTVNDPQGLTIKGALHSLGFGEVDSVRAGKYMELRVEAKDKKTAEKQLADMCDK